MIDAARLYQLKEEFLKPLDVAAKSLLRLGTLASPATTMVVLPTETSAVSESAAGQPSDFGFVSKFVDIQAFGLTVAGGSSRNPVVKFYNYSGGPINAIGMEIPAGAFYSLPIQARYVTVWCPSGTARIEFRWYR